MRYLAARCSRQTAETRTESPTAAICRILLGILGRIFPFPVGDILGFQPGEDGLHAASVVEKLCSWT